MIILVNIEKKKNLFISGFELQIKFNGKTNTNKQLVVVVFGSQNEKKKTSVNRPALYGCVSSFKKGYW